jgi:hypothetical protein
MGVGIYIFVNPKRVFLAQEVNRRIRAGWEPVGKTERTPEGEWFQVVVTERALLKRKGEII